MALRSRYWRISTPWRPADCCLPRCCGSTWTCLPAQAAFCAPRPCRASPNPTDATWGRRTRHFLRRSVMDRKLTSVVIALVAVFVVFLLIAWIGPNFNESLQLDETAVLRFVFVGIGLLVVFVVYWLTRS